MNIPENETVMDDPSGWKSTMDIKHVLNQQRLLVEEALEKYMLEDEGPLAHHVKAMRYSLFAGGKRIRPILCLAAAESLGANEEHFLPVACAFEIIHTYSLIHDDLPAMDNDELRRGKPTNHMVFGEAEAILAGDGLLTYAFELLSSPDLSGKLADADRLRIINIISEAAGSRGMVGGQALDIASEGKSISFETLRFIHSHKTGALIKAAIETGAVLGGADKDQFQALSGYGRNIGLAFQIVDDLLNVTGTQEELGKAIGSDEERRKATYPSFFGIEATRNKAHEAAAHAIAALSAFDHKADFLRGLADYVVTRKR